MGDWYGTFATIDRMYLWCAVVGGVLFTARVVLQFAGLFDAGDIGDVDGDVDVGDVDHGDVHHDLAHDTDYSFKLLSLHGLTAFVLMFGLVGLTLRREFDSGVTTSMAGAFTGGLVANLLIQSLFGVMMKMQSSGTLKMSNAIGLEGSVYLTIPAGGIGKARITIQDRLQVFDARCDQNVEISTGTLVRVLRVVDGSVLVVEKA